MHIFIFTCIGIVLAYMLKRVNRLEGSSMATETELRDRMRVVEANHSESSAAIANITADVDGLIAKVAELEEQIANEEVSPETAHLVEALVTSSEGLRSSLAGIVDKV